MSLRSVVLERQNSPSDGRWLVASSLPYRGVLQPVTSANNDRALEHSVAMLELFLVISSLMNKATGVGKFDDQTFVPGR